MTKNEEELAIIQFVHPGSQYGLPRGNQMGWNKKTYHRRKFLKTKGQYVDAGGSTVEADLCFWGEWEPDSYFEKISPEMPNPKDYPNAVHTPILKMGETDIEAKNTDPLVLTGGEFIYSLCQQYRKYNKNQVKPTLLNCLAPGSIILFGSHISETNGETYFALDTVFVVACSRRYKESTAQESLGDFVPDDYYYIRRLGQSASSSSCSAPAKSGCSPVSSCNTDMELNCYKGATVKNPVDGMFSFVPCRKADGNGFGRVKLTQAELSGISNKLQQGFNGIELNESPKTFWDRLKEIVESQGYLLGVQFSYEKPEE